MDLNSKIKKAMAAAGLNYSALARAAGCSPENVRMLADGRTQPKFLLGMRLAAALRIPPEWLADPKAAWPPPKTEKQSALDLVVKALTQQGLAGELSQPERAMLAAYRCLAPTAQALVFGRLQGMLDAEIAGSQASPIQDAAGVQDDAAAVLAARLAEAAELLRAHPASDGATRKARRKA